MEKTGKALMKEIRREWQNEFFLMSINEDSGWTGNATTDARKNCIESMIARRKRLPTFSWGRLPITFFTPEERQIYSEDIKETEKIFRKNFIP